MSELGIIASRFRTNTDSLREFDEALRLLKNMKDVKRDEKTTKLIDNLLSVIHPITESMKNILSDTTIINEKSVYRILQDRHNKDWSNYKKSILELETKLSKDNITLSQVDFDVLNDIADALDAECTDLFQRMGESR